MPSTDGPLAGKACLIVGGAAGIGAAVAAELTAQGGQVVVTSRSTGPARLDGATQVQMDIRDAASVEHGVAVARDRLGRLDVLVCNAGIAGPTARLHEADFDEWRDTLEVNVFGTTRVLRAALPPLVEQRHGAVVVIGSMTGKRPLANRTAYATSKMALVGLVRSLAAEIGPDGVRVNLVSPGPVDGERLHRVIEQQVATTAVGFAETRQKLLGDSMLIGAVPPRDVARTVAFLASDHAASITGEDVNVSRGIVCH